ncbi:hypothetical protein IE81DRAFT_319188 [Ceraceosorus guamensis]|uniref:Uncharacterized protein n=1 Tax=Ceraceosorus guamensis TaxID=1522189 RepID=A0A316WCF0_9BASI|nr:hypothetical protein IE81DRAFT_319188 [Ceraceosorus guamensis]PWN46301.1 hypothetical protein IE81DRAFT_319188 [Ceraceosorus guamensis]
MTDQQSAFEHALPCPYMLLEPSPRGESVFCLHVLVFVLLDTLKTRASGMQESDETRFVPDPIGVDLPVMCVRACETSPPLPLPACADSPIG